MDGRLVPPAVGAWLAAALAGWAFDAAASVHDRHDRAMWLGGGVVVLLGAVWGCLAVRGTRGVVVRQLRRQRGLQGVAMVAAGAVAGALGVALLMLSWAAEPVASWIDSSATAQVTAVVTGEPVTRQPRPGMWGGGSVEVRALATSVEARGSSVDVALPIEIRGPVGTRSPPPGSTVQLVGRLRFVPVRSGVSVGLTVGESTRWIVVGAPGPLDTTAHAMRTGLRRALDGVPEEAGSLVAGLAIGDESRQSMELAQDMRASGLSHLTAVSGGNVAIILGSVLVLAAALRLALAMRAVVALAALGFFVLLVGPQASVLRAAAMGSVAVIALVLGGRRAGPSVLCTAVLVLVIVSPWLALSWAFALSVFATAGLVLLSPILDARLARSPVVRRLPAPVRQALTVTMAAQLATLPVLVAMGGAAGWVAIPANLLAMPVVPAVTILGLVAAALSPVLPAAAGAAAYGAAWPAGWIAHVAHACAAIPGASVPWPSGWAGPMLLGVLLAVALGLRSLHRRLPGDRTRRARVALGVLIAGLIVIATLPPARRGWPPDGWLLTMCDVGQGDALVLHAGEGSAVLVDAGPDPALLDRCLDDLGIASLPLVVLTHFHADHVHGLSGAFTGRDVGTVLATPVHEPAELTSEVGAVLSRHARRVGDLTAQEVVDIGGIRLRALWPRRRISSGSVPNNASVVLDATVGGHRFLLMGDVEPEAQTAMAADLQAARFEVVKVAHHGSRHQAPDLTRWVPARLALISVGADNDYGHPAPETVDSWRAIGALVLRTDLSGDVAIVEDGSGLGVVVRGGMLPSP